MLRFVAFFQMILAGPGCRVAGLHPVDAMLLLGLFGWPAYRLRHELPEESVATAPAVASLGFVTRFIPEEG